jgi:hypothetical protein
MVAPLQSYQYPLQIPGRLRVSIRIAAAQRDPHGAKDGFKTIAGILAMYLNPSRQPFENAECFSSIGFGLAVLAKSLDVTKDAFVQRAMALNTLCAFFFQVFKQPFAAVYALQVKQYSHSADDKSHNPGGQPVDKLASLQRCGQSV